MLALQELYLLGLEPIFEIHKMVVIVHGHPSYVYDITNVTKPIGIPLRTKCSTKFFKFHSHNTLTFGK